MRNALKLLPLLLVTTFSIHYLSALAYNALIPYYFAGQWQPTPETLNLTGTYEIAEEVGVFLGQHVQSTDVSTKSPVSAEVLGETDPGTVVHKKIEVDLSKQMVYAFENEKVVMEFLISSGKWGKTPTGRFTIAYKTLAQKMSGGSRALGTYYYLPNVQFVQFFGNKEIPWSRGFSFHGTYWHNNFGTPMSHGCINMTNEDAEKLFYWTTPSTGDKRIVRATEDDPGTPVFIYGVPPSN